MTTFIGEKKKSVGRIVVEATLQIENGFNYVITVSPPPPLQSSQQSVGCDKAEPV